VDTAASTASVAGRFPVVRPAARASPYPWPPGVIGYRARRQPATAERI